MFLTLTMTIFTETGDGVPGRDSLFQDPRRIGVGNVPPHLAHLAAHPVMFQPGLFGGHPNAFNHLPPPVPFGGLPPMHYHQVYE